MQIIKSTPNTSGAYPAMQSWDITVPTGAEPTGEAYVPAGYYLVPDTLDTTVFSQYNGFVLLTVDGNRVTAMTPNTAAWEVWKAEHPEPETNPVTGWERLRADLDYISIMTGVDLA